MRADMYKVIVDRPRSLSRSFSKLRNDYRAAKKFRLDEDGDVCDEFSRRILPIRSRRVGYDYKEFNDLLSPLQRYLKKQVGRPWADVWSEICSVNSADSKLQWHLRCHVLGAVYLNCCYAFDGMGAVQVMGQGGISRLAAAHYMLIRKRRISARLVPERFGSAGPGDLSFITANIFDLHRQAGQLKMFKQRR